MFGTRGDDGYIPSVQAFGRAVDRELEFAFDHVRHLFMRVRVFRKCGAGFDLPVDEGHIRRMYYPRIITGKLFDSFGILKSDEHDSFLLKAIRSKERALIVFRSANEIYGMRI